MLLAIRVVNVRKKNKKKRLYTIRVNQSGEVRMYVGVREIRVRWREMKIDGIEMHDIGCVCVGVKMRRIRMIFSYVRFRGLS